jgi:hypothetical protein
MIYDIQSWREQAWKNDIQKTTSSSINSGLYLETYHGAMRAGARFHILMFEHGGQASAVARSIFANVHQRSRIG